MARNHLAKADLAAPLQFLPDVSRQLGPTTTTTYTYERNETVTVPAGSFNTCRYKMVTEGSAGYTTMWVINGRGVSAKMENVNGAGVVEYRAELKSASINGGAL